MIEESQITNAILRIAYSAELFTWSDYSDRGGGGVISWNNLTGSILDEYLETKKIVEKELMQHELVTKILMAELKECFKQHWVAFGYAVKSLSRILVVAGSFEVLDVLIGESIRENHIMKIDNENMDGKKISIRELISRKKAHDLRSKTIENTEEFS